MLCNELPAAASAHIGGTCCETASENLRLGLGQGWKSGTLARGAGQAMQGCGLQSSSSMNGRVLTANVLLKDAGFF